MKNNLFPNSPTWSKVAFHNINLLLYEEITKERNSQLIENIFSIKSDECMTKQVPYPQSSSRRPPAHCSSPPPAPVPVAALRKRTPSGRFMDTINPLLSFSSDDIADMDREVSYSNMTSIKSLRLSTVFLATFQSRKLNMFAHLHL